MKIRSITLFTNLTYPFDAEELISLGKVARKAADTYRTAGYDVQTIRLATNLLAHYNQRADLVEAVIELESVCQDAGFEFVSLGPATAENLHLVPEILQATQNCFATCQIVAPDAHTIDGEQIWEAAKVIRKASGIASGFGNLRFAALANVRPGTPFFPAAYAPPAWGNAKEQNHRPAFAVATESADLALAAAQAPTSKEAHHRLRQAIETHARRIEATAADLTKDQELRFWGTDFSLAPFPGAETSIGGALEALTGLPLGSPGTLTAAATLTSAIQEAAFHHIGFCGLMLPVLEDSVLAQRAAEGRLRIPELLQWSAVCGTGLDTVPIPGDVGEATLANLLFDVAALATRLNKPLTARLMPLPGKGAGDPVHFDFAYFADGGVLALGDGTANRLTATPNLRLTPYERPA